jgi:UDPglucose 6-dehydrogenase
LMKSISVFGIGKLGFPIIACFAKHGYRVIGFDINPDVVKSVNEKRPLIYEPGLTELLQESEGISATDDYLYAVNNSEATFIVVATPSQADGSFSTEYAEAAAEQIASGIRNKDSYHLIILTSTVLPGVTQGKIKTILEKTSGKKCGQDFGLCYSPEFIALGTVIRDFLNPDVVLIGESDKKAGDLLSEMYKNVCENDPPIVRMSINSAELAKISLNAFVTMKISFANTIAELCEHIPDGDSEAISSMLGLDSRIGRKYLSGALAYGGPCFPRDNKAFTFFARQTGCDARLAEATDTENRHQNDRILSIIKQKIGNVRDKKIAILGLTYKPNTDVIEESAAVKIADALLQQGAHLSIYDPAAMENARRILGDRDIRYTASAKECLKGAELCILATPWPEFKDLKPEDFLNSMQRPVILDCWRFFDTTGYTEKIEYTTIGLYSGGEYEKYVRNE